MESVISIPGGGPATQPLPLFVLYDMRAANGCPDDATVLVSARGEAEAIRETRELGFDGIWYEYPVFKDSTGPSEPGELGEGVPRYDLPPFNKESEPRHGKCHYHPRRRAGHGAARGPG